MQTTRSTDLGIEWHREAPPAQTALRLQCTGATSVEVRRMDQAFASGKKAADMLGSGEQD